MLVAGKRICLGENLARMETFMTAAALVQVYQFKAVPGEEYCLTPNKGDPFLNEPLPYRVDIQLRGDTED
jgi:cytochrome P450